MGKKCFSESQIIMFIAFFGIFILITLPFFNNIIKTQEEVKYEKNIDAIVEASRNYFSTKEKVYQTIYVDVKDLIRLKYLSKDKLSGCVKISYNDKTMGYNYNYSSSECVDIMTIKDILMNKTLNSSDIYKNGNKYYYKGNNPNNYILINNSLYRILSFDYDSIKLITNDIILNKSFDSNNIRNNIQNIYCMDNLFGCNIYAANGIEITQDSEINQYLENVYSKFDNSNILLTNSSWDIGLVNSNYDKYIIEDGVTTTQVSSKIGLISLNDYILASSNSNYEIDNWLNNNEEYWTLTGVLDNNYEVYSIANKVNKRTASDILGVRPVISINSNLYGIGEGTIDSPFIINLK